MKYLLTLTFLPALLLSTATMQYPIRDYTNIELNGPIRTTFKQNGTTSLFISANSQHLLSKISVQQDPTTVYITVINDEWNLNFNSVEVVISGKQIQSINVTGAGRVQAAEVRLLAGGSFNITGSSRVSYNVVEAEDMAILETGASQLEINSIASKSVDLRVEGSSQLEIKTGSINELVASAKGASQINLNDVIVDNADLDATGASQIKLTVTGKARVNAVGASQVDVRGGGVVESKSDSTSTVTQENGNLQHGDGSQAEEVVGQGEAQGDWVERAIGEGWGEGWSD